MAFKIIWSKPALDDLRSLTAFIAEDNPLAAEKMGLAILGKTRYLAEYPLFGRMIPEIRRKEVRELIHRPYRIIYRVDMKARTAEVIRIWHSARGEPEF